MTDPKDTVLDMVCLTCARPTLRVVHHGVATFRHSLLGDDHEVVPVPRSEMVKVKNRCDFCCNHDEPVEWVYYTHEEVRNILATPTSTDEKERRQFAKNWETISSKPGPHVEHMRSTLARGWAACEPCATLIELRDLERLITRARRVGPPPMPETGRRLFHNTWEPVLRDLSHRVPLTPQGEGKDTS